MPSATASESRRATPAEMHLQPRMREREFRLLRDFIRSACGMQLSDAKMTLMQNRIGKRVRALGMTSYAEYHEFLQTSRGRACELSNLFSAITTNETHFFREPHHYDILTRTVLPELTAGAAVSGPLRVWSAGCSTGQEAYTLAMLLAEALPGRKISVLGTDIDAQVLATAEAGRYPAGLRREVPARHLLRWLDLDGDWLQVKAELRGCVTFRWQNLATATVVRPRVHVIFCRNVIMYLHQEIRARLSGLFRASLVDGGFLFLGSSESFHGLPRLFVTRRSGKSTYYQKLAGKEATDGDL